MYVCLCVYNSVCTPVGVVCMLCVSPDMKCLYINLLYSNQLHDCVCTPVDMCVYAGMCVCVCMFV